MTVKTSSYVLDEATWRTASNKDIEKAISNLNFEIEKLTDKAKVYQEAAERYSQIKAALEKRLGLEAFM